MADFTQDELRAEAIRRGLIPAGNASSDSSEPSDGGLLQNGDTTNSFGLLSHPVANLEKAGRGIQNAAGGLMGSVQRAGAFLSTPIEYATHGAYQALTGNKVPHYNMRELWGLEGENPVDLRQEIANDPNSTMASVGSILPAVAMGGASIPGQMAAQGLWGASQADPGNRIEAGLTDAALTGATMGAFKAFPWVQKTVGKVANYLNPGKTAEQFLGSLGKGTREQNVQQLAKMIQDSHQSQVESALSHKNPIYEQEAGLDLYKTPETALPEGNLDKVAYYINGGEKTTPEQLDALSKEIKNLRTGKVGGDPYDFEDFTHEVGNIFNTDLNPTQMGNLETAMNIPTTQPDAFRTLAASNEKYIEGNTKDLYDKFLKKPTLSNADALQSQLGDDWGYYDNLRKQGKLEPAMKPTMERLKQLRDSLKNDMLEALNRKNPAYGEEIAKYNKKWRENVVPYGEEPFTQNIVGEGKNIREQRAANPDIPFDVTPESAQSYFANPSKDALKVAGDIGEEGQNRILYNLLGGDLKPDAKGLALAIQNAKQSQGYGRYITPEMDSLAEQLIKRANWRRRARNIGYGLAGTAGLAGSEELWRKYL